MGRMMRLPWRGREGEVGSLAKEAESLLDWLVTEGIKRVWCLDSYSAVTAYAGCDWLSSILSLRVGEADLDYLYQNVFPGYSLVLEPRVGFVTFGYCGDSCSWFTETRQVVCVDVQSVSDTVDMVEVGFHGHRIYCRHPMNVFTSLFIPLLQGLSQCPELDLVACTLLVEADAMSFTESDVERIQEETGCKTLKSMFEIVGDYALDVDFDLEAVPRVHGLLGGKYVIDATGRECVEIIARAMEAVKGE